MNEDCCYFMLVSQLELSRLAVEELESLVRGVSGDMGGRESV